MAPPRAGTNELGGSATAVRPAMEAGEEKIIRETCWARRVKVTETVTQREKVNGVTETCTRHIETRGVMNEVTELAETRRETQELKEIIETWEMGTIEKRLHGTDRVKDAHTHTHTHRGGGGQWG